MTVELMLADGDLVAARWTTEGTHTGPWGDMPPTGKHVGFSGVKIFRLAGGKVVEIWNHRDDLGVLEQLQVPIYIYFFSLANDRPFLRRARRS